MESQVSKHCDLHVTATGQEGQGQEAPRFDQVMEAASKGRQAR